MTTTNHPIVAQPWQLKPDLGAVLVPLLPEPESNGFFWSWSPTLLTVLKIWADKLPFSDYDLLDWQVGDRIYLQDEYCDLREYFPGRNDAFTLKSELLLNANSEAGLNALHMDSLWQPAHTMPPEAAQFWYEITSIEVTQAKALDMPTLIASRLTSWCDPSEDPRLLESEVAHNWNKCHPEHPWHGDRFVVVLRTKILEDSH